MLKLQVIINPSDNVVFEGALDQLMKKVRGD